MENQKQEFLERLDIEKSADVAFALQAFERAQKKLEPVQSEYFEAQEALASAVMASGCEVALVAIGDQAKLVSVDSLRFVTVQPISVT